MGESQAELEKRRGHNYFHMIYEGIYDWLVQAAVLTRNFDVESMNKIKRITMCSLSNK